MKSRVLLSMGVAGVALAAQANFAKPRIAGMVVASQFGQWSASVDGPIATGMQTVELRGAAFTLPDGTAWMPLAAGNPVLITGDAAQEVVVPSTVNCSLQGPSCKFTAVFAHAHPGRARVSSATAGLQEAINFAGPGGWVTDDLTVANVYAPIVINNTLRLSGFSNFDNATGTRILQQTPNTDVIQVGSTVSFASDVVLEDLMAVGVSGAGTDAGVAIHCVNCVRLKLDNVTGKQAHDGLFLDSSYNHAFTASIRDSHFIGNYYGVHMVGASANRDTFVGNTIDANAYGVFDDGGWVHTWFGNDIESNSQYGYWQQVSNPAAWSGHNVVLHGNYFENNGTSSGQGDIFLGQLVNGGTGNNGAGCINCEITDNLLNGSNATVTAVNLGAVTGTMSDNTYSGYASGNIYAYITGPSPNFTHVMLLGDCGTTPSAGTPCPQSIPGALTRLDSNGALVIGGTDQLTDIHGTPLQDTTIESPTGVVRFRGLQGGAMATNPAQVALDGNSTASRSNEMKWRNAGVDEWGVKNDVAGANAHDFCPVNDYANPASATCDLYINQQKHFLFSAAGPPGNITFDADYRFQQQANGDPAIQIMRHTDASPAGYLIDLEDSTESHPLFRVDVTGTVTTGNWNNSGSSFTVGPISATTGSFSGAIAAAAGSTVGGNPISTAAPNPAAQSGTLFASSSFAADTCQTAAVTFASGVAVGMAVATNPESAPPAGLVWNAVIDASNHVTLRLCNVTAATVVWPTGAIWDVRVLP